MRQETSQKQVAGEPEQLPPGGQQSVKPAAAQEPAVSAGRGGGGEGKKR